MWIEGWVEKLELSVKNEEVLRWDIDSWIGVFENGEYLEFED